MAHGVEPSSGPAGAGRPDLVGALIEVSFVVQRVVDRSTSPHDGTVSQLRLLGLLNDCRPRMAELATLMGLEKSSLTGLIKRAEARGLVSRRPVDGDRRSFRVELTALGRQHVEHMRQHVDERIVCSRDEDYLERLHDLCVGLISELTTLHRGRSEA